MGERQNILVVEVDPEIYQRLAPVLQRANFEVDRFPGASGALELVTLRPFTAVILGYPMREVAFERFLQELQDGESAAASVAVLTDASHRAEAETYLASGVDLVLDRERPKDEMMRLMCSVLGVAPRLATRVLVKLELSMVEATSNDRFIAQTEDLSVSGMLVVTNRRYPLGSTARFEIALPGDRGAVRGEAQVMRHTGNEEKRQGMGFRFVSFRPGEQAKLESYLDLAG